MLKRVKARPMVKARGHIYWQRVLGHTRDGLTVATDSTPQLMRDQNGYLWLVAWDPDEDNLYRVAIDPLTKRVEIICLGIDAADTAVEGIYKDTSELPDWAQERLAVLSMMESKPPTTPVEGIGQRIDQYTFWIVR